MTGAIYLNCEQQEHLMREALEEAKRGVEEGEAPIGCVIARPVGPNGEVEIVARGHNQMNALQSKIAHAEIMTFQNGAGGGKKEPAIPLDCKDAIMVSTLEPCVMCLGAAMETGVALVLFGLQAPADNGTQRMKPPQSPDNTNPPIIGGILADESRALFVEWLKGKEGTPQAKFVEQLLALTDAEPARK